MAVSWWPVAARVALVCAVCACGRIAFEPSDDANTAAGDAGDVDLADAGITSGVRVWVYEISIPGPGNVIDIPIEPVDIDRTMLLCDFRTGHSSVARQPACELRSSTTLRFFVGQPEPTLRVRAQLVQLPVGSRVQRGLQVLGSGAPSQAISIATVDLGRAFPLFTRSGNVEATGFDDRFSLRARLASAQSLVFDRYATGNTVTIPWQVVEIAGSRVVSGGVQLTDGTGGIAQLDVAVELDRSFVVVNGRTTSSAEADYLVRPTLAQGDPDLVLMLERAGTSGMVDVAWYAVELPTGSSTVVHGVTAMGAAATLVQTLPAAVELARTAAIIGTSGGRPGQNADVEQVLVTPALHATELELTRNAALALDVGGLVSWSLVQWAP